MSLHKLNVGSSRFGWIVGGLVALIVATACSTAENSESANGQATTVVIENTGSSELEGHTPQGFAGSGTGLFAGDNLNANFPQGEGVQIFIAFELADLPDEITNATLSSEALTERGTPFETLGPLRAQAVSFQSFGPPVFETPGLGSAVECIRTGESAIDCDVTEAAVDAQADGRSELQFRLRFDTPGDGDGEQDLALFFLTDSNTNEPGIFSLTLS